MVELVGNDYTGNKPLIKATAVLDDNYYNNLIYPLIYKDYSMLGFSIKYRKSEPFGIPPRKAIVLNNKYLTEIENGIFNGVVKNIFPYIYDLPRVYKNDFLDLRNQVINHHLKFVPDALTRFFTGRYPFISHGYYKADIEYILPGEDKGTRIPFEYYNFIK